MPALYEIQIQIETRGPKANAFGTLAGTCGSRLRRPRVLVSRLQKNIRAILKVLGWEKGASLSLLLAGDRSIRKLNKKYLGHDCATDVISFSQLEGKPLPSKKGVAFLGDIVISLETTARQAAEYGNSFDYELHFYICHGILHLMGWDDKVKKEAARMFAKQTQILKKIGIKSV